MSQTAWELTCRCLFATVAIGVLSAAGPIASHAETTAAVVPITSEPDHRIRFDNGRVCMYEVLLPKGKGTLMHEHRADSFAVFFKTAEVTNEPRDGNPATRTVPAGLVTFTSTAKGPYSHRVVASGDTPFHVIAMELLGGSSMTSENPSKRPNPPFKIALENSRGRVYRITLNPGEATETYTRPANSALFAISSGRISELADGRTEKLWDFDPGGFRWFDLTETLAMKNAGSTPVDLVEIEIY